MDTETWDTHTFKSHAGNSVKDEEGIQDFQMAEMLAFWSQSLLWKTPAISPESISIFSTLHP